MTASDSERMEILEMIQKGTISPAEGDLLLEALQQGSPDASLEPDLSVDDKVPAPSTGDPGLEEDLTHHKRWWVLPFWIGTGLTALGGWLMYLGWSVDGFGLGFVAAWIPFLIGIGLLVLGWNSRTGPWIHLRVEGKSGESPRMIQFSLPLPIRLAAWAVRTFGSFAPGVDPHSLEELVLAAGSPPAGGAPLNIEINEGDDGENVRVIIA